MLKMRSKRPDYRSTNRSGWLRGTLSEYQRNRNSIFGEVL